MFDGLRRGIRNFIHPLSTIAAELTIIRELYERELLEHTDHKGNPAPIRRFTEKPSPRDTTVSYMGQDDPKEDIFDPFDSDDEEGDQSVFPPHLR